MSNANRDAEKMFTSETVYQLPFKGVIEANIPFGAGPRVMDIYYPENCSTLTPTVIFVSGYRGAGFEKMTGRKLKEIAQNTSWGKLIAASGMIAIHYCAEEPLTDVQLLIDYLSEHSDELHINCESLALWSCSGNVPCALNALNGGANIRCAVLYYGFMLDLGKGKSVATAAAQFGFAIPTEETKQTLCSLPLFIVRAGLDQFAGVNESIHSYLVEALQKNVNISVTNHANGRHAFDIFDDTAESKRIIEASLTFLQHHLAGCC